MQRKNVGSGLRSETELGYSRLVKVGPHIYISGTTALAAGELVGEGDALAQARQCLSNIESALAQVGADLADVVRTRVFVCDIERNADAVAQAHRESLGDCMPATSLLGVSALIDPRMLVEIEADAIKGAGRLGAGERPRIVQASFSSDSDLADMLRSVDLPLPAPGEPVVMLKAYLGGELVGCVGYERFGSHALLHSLVVIRQAKGEGVGRFLVEQLLGRLRAAGVEQVYLATTDTARYFGYLGFRPVTRDEVEPAVLQSPDLSAYEDGQATFMRYTMD